MIIGGGPAGATVGLLLAEAGWSGRHNREETFSTSVKLCGEFISATSLSLLQQLGISDFYLANGGPEVKQIGLYAGDTILTSKYASS